MRQGFETILSAVLHMTVVAYVGILLVYVLLRITTGERTTLVVVGNILLHYILLGAPLLLIFVLLMRMWWHSVPLVVLTLVFTILYGGRFLPKNGSITQAGDRALRVMTYNTAAHNLSAQDLLAQVEGSAADIVVLVELDSDNGVYISEALRSEYPYIIAEGTGIGGKAIFSRHRIVAQETFTLLTDRPNLFAEIEIDDTKVAVYAVHPPSPDRHDGLNFYRPDPNNAAEVGMLLRRVDTSVPTLLMGDFNFTEHTPSYGHVQRAGLIDAYRTSGKGFGNTFFWEWEFLVPVVRIDYIWHSPHFSAASAYVGEPKTSDHAPVIADLILK